MSKIDVVCPNCGGPVVADATAQWDAEAQEWQLCDHDYGYFWCQSSECGWEGKWADEKALEGDAL